MPRAKWNPPKYLEDKERVRCTICHGTSEVGLGRYSVASKGLKSHLSCDLHQVCWESHLERERQHALELEEFSEGYCDAVGVAAFPDFESPAPSYPPAMFSVSETDASFYQPTLSAAQLIEELGDGMQAAPSTKEKKTLLWQQYEDMLMDAYQETYFDGKDGIDDQFVGDKMPTGLNDTEEEEAECFDLSALAASAYHPYPSKAAMLLDVMDNFPRCRFSSAQMNLVIHFAKSLGVPNVPTLKGLRNIQQSLQSSCGSEPTRIESAQGNVFYINDIREMLARDFANPLIVPHMHFYPEETNGPISETFQAERWTEYTPEQLTPMFTKGQRCFWINELACLADGRFVIPLLWIVRNGILEADVFEVTLKPDSRWELHAGEDGFSSIIASDLEHDYDEIKNKFGENLVWVDDSQVPAMPNPLRKLVDDDEELFVIMVSPWADDVSGNRSKQYNKHINLYTGNGCLPGRLLQQEFHIHFISSSPHTSSAEQFAAFRDQVKSTETNPAKALNAVTKRKCRFIIRVPGLPADNPQQSEEASHMGSRANFPCRKCHWGGTNLEKETDETYHGCHLAGAARSADEICSSLQSQLHLAMRGDAKGVEKLQRATGTKDKFTQYWIEQLITKYQQLKGERPRRQTGDDILAEVQKWFSEQPGDKMNPLLDITGLDPSQDTPLELLHTILLRVMKYIWHHMNTEQWSDTDRHLLAIRLQSTDLSGLTVPPLRAGYMIQYRNNLIGKHFKTLMQILSLHVHHISMPQQFTLIKVAAELGVRLWVPEIDGMNEYLTQIEIAAANLLNAFDAVDPLRILTKIKLHLLAHIMDDVRRFGPLIRCSTEIYEMFNGVFRLCSVLSNHLAPSRDISRKFASMDRVKHLLSGGYWYDSQSKKWVQAGKAVQDVLRGDTTVQRHLGWVVSKVVVPGKIEPAPLKKSPILEWQNSVAAKHWNSDDDFIPQPQSIWRHGRSLIAQSGDQATVRSWVIAKDKQGHTVFGRIHELLTAESKGFVTLEQFTCSKQLHCDLSWPVLRRPTGSEIVQGTKSFLVLPSTSIQFGMSVQHDCRRGDCQPVISGKEMQEREATARDKSLIKHMDDDYFIINMGALHNFTKLCRVLLPKFTRLSLLFPEREEFHKAVARRARAGRDARRKKTASKRRKNAEAKKREAEDAEEAALEAEQAVIEGRDLEGEEDGADASDHEEGLAPRAESDCEDDGMDDGEYQPQQSRLRGKKRGTN